MRSDVINGHHRRLFEHITFVSHLQASMVRVLVPSKGHPFIMVFRPFKALDLALLWQGRVKLIRYDVSSVQELE